MTRDVESDQDLDGTSRCCSLASSTSSCSDVEMTTITNGSSSCVQATHSPAYAHELQEPLCNVTEDSSVTPATDEQEQDFREQLQKAILEEQSPATLDLEEQQVPTTASSTASSSARAPQMSLQAAQLFLG
ncbi:unnamed protein product, partial [Amoebophrya sp. A25]|eukprot:GSA25T00010397001.1